MKSFASRILLWMIGGGAILLLSSEPVAAQPPSVSSSMVDRVSVLTVARKNLKWISSQPGRILSYEETPITSKLSGFVEEVLVDIGDPVKKNQVLIRLSIPEMADELKQKEALLAQAQAEVSQAESAVRAAEAAIATAVANIDEANAGRGRVAAELERAKAEHGRIQRLADQGAVTAKLADELLSQLRAAEAAEVEIDAKVKSAEAAKLQAKANVEKSIADLGAHQARRQVAEANLGQLRTLLNYLEIRAPFDGVVVKRSVDTGHYVQPAQTQGPPLLVVARMDKVRFCVEIPEMEASAIDAGEKGDEVSISIQSLGKKTIDGRVTRTAWGLTDANRSLRTEVDLDNPDRRLRPGMYATASIILDQRSDVIALPLTAVVRKEDKVYCCVVRENKIELRPIELGLRAGPEVEIVSGLQVGEMVVIARGESLIDGQPVAVTPPATK